MSDKFKELFEEARTSGVDSDWVDRFETTFEASGLRKDNQAMRDKYATLAEQTTKLKAGMLKDRFTSLGITISPSILNIPDDLDPSDPEVVKTWAVTTGLIPDQPTTPVEDRATHDRIATASNEGGVSSIPSLQDLDPTKLTEEEFWVKANEREAALKSKR